MSRQRTTEPRLLPEEDAVWIALKRLSEQALTRVAAEIERATGLSGGDFGILSRLVDLGDGVLGQRDLGASLHWEKSRLSHQLRRMEARQLVSRQPTPVARGVKVAITPKGRRLITAARPVHTQAVRAHILERLDAPSRKALLAISAHLSGPV